MLTLFWIIDVNGLPEPVLEYKISLLVNIKSMLVNIYASDDIVIVVSTDLSMLTLIYQC